MKDKWLTIKCIDGTISKIRKDRIVSFIIWNDVISIYVHTHVGRTMFEFGLEEECRGCDLPISKATFSRLRTYFLEQTKIGGELNLDPE